MGSLIAAIITSGWQLPADFFFNPHALRFEAKAWRYGQESLYREIYVPSAYKFNQRKQRKFGDWRIIPLSG